MGQLHFEKLLAQAQVEYAAARFEAHVMLAVTAATPPHDPFPAKFGTALRIVVKLRQLREEFFAELTELIRQRRVFCEDRDATGRRCFTFNPQAIIDARR
jgi:hypothetical protein